MRMLYCRWQNWKQDNSRLYNVVCFLRCYLPRIMFVEPVLKPSRKSTLISCPAGVSGFLLFIRLSSLGLENDEHEMVLNFWTPLLIHMKLKIISLCKLIRKREDVYRIVKIYAAKGESNAPEAKCYLQCLVRKIESCAPWYIALKVFTVSDISTISYNQGVKPLLNV